MWLVALEEGDAAVLQGPPPLQPVVLLGVLRLVPANENVTVHFRIKLTSVVHRRILARVCFTSLGFRLSCRDIRPRVLIVGRRIQIGSN